jgi:phosphoribosylformylglycinamidine (FGAM) synthase PurS component
VRVIEFALDLTAYDNAAFTVRTALRGLGYEALERVERSELLWLHVPESESAETTARALARAEIVFNPNKHRLAYANGVEDEAEPEAVVRDNDDDASALRNALRDHFGMHALDRIERATAWRLYEQGKPAREERLVWACAKLLANPHSQAYAIRRRPSYVTVEAAPRDRAAVWANPS